MGSAQVNLRLRNNTEKERSEQELVNVIRPITVPSKK